MHVVISSIPMIRDYCIVRMDSDALLDICFIRFCPRARMRFLLRVYFFLFPVCFFVFLRVCDCIVVCYSM